MNKRKGCLWLLLAMMLTVAISSLAYATEQQLIQSVSVQISLPDGQELHPTIEGRVRESIGTVASTVLVGQQVSLIRKTQREIGQLVKTVFNRVIRGYRILDITMAVGEKTVIVLKLQPTSVLIQQVHMRLQLYGLDDKIVHVVERELAELNRQAEELMVGLPVDALIWAEDVIEPVLSGLIAWYLPGFTPTLQLAFGSEVQVELALQPHGDRIEEIQVDLTTVSLPRMLIPALERKMEKELQIFYGLPVAFLQRYEDRVYQAVENALHEERWSKHVYLNSKPKIELDSTTHLAFDVEWIDYQIDFVSVLNLGVNAPDSGLRLSLGKKFTPWLVVRLQDEFTFRHPMGTLSAGVTVNPGNGFQTNIEYHIRDANWDVAVDWRNGRYGWTITQTIPGQLRDIRLSANYYPRLSSQVSLELETDKLWVSWKQTL